MCYRAPGPRCSSCTRNRLNRATLALGNTNPNDTEAYLIAKARYERVLTEWHSTPAGIKELLAAGRTQEAEYNRALRTTQVAAYRHSALAKAKNRATPVEELNTLLLDRSIGKEARRASALALAKKHPVWAAFGNPNKTADMLLGVAA